MPKKRPRKSPKVYRGPEDWFLREWREEIGMTPKELAEKLGVHEDTVGSWEASRRHVDRRTLRDIAWALGIKYPGLLTLMNPKKVKFWATLATADADELRQFDLTARVIEQARLDNPKESHSVVTSRTEGRARLRNPKQG